MLINLFILIVKILASIPVLRSIIKLPYSYTIRKIQERFLQDEDIQDIFLISDINSKDFSLGLSDLNFIIMANDSYHPKIVLRKFRSFIEEKWYFKFLINTKYIPILNQEEFKVHSFNSYLLRNYHENAISWPSLIKGESHDVTLGVQDQLSVSNYAIQTLDRLILSDSSKKLKRSKLKNIYRSMTTLAKTLPTSFSPTSEWKRTTRLIQRFPILTNFFYGKILKESWKSMTKAPVNKRILLKGHQSHLIPEELQQHMHKLLTMSFIDDIVCTPSIIQHKSEELQGKLFIEVLVNQQLTKNSFLKHINHLKEGILAFETERLKLRIKLTTSSILKEQMRLSLYSFPLEGFYRQKASFSLSNTSFYQENQIEIKNTYFSATHFFINQFMRFRSFEQQTSLIGSKFIKSLNLMYRYQLLADFLRKQEFNVERSETKIREYLTPQFSKLKWDDIVTDDDWQTIRAQLIYLLKEIQKELIKKDPSLAVLKL